MSLPQASFCENGQDESTGERREGEEHGLFPGRAEGISGGDCRMRVEEEGRGRIVPLL